MKERYYLKNGEFVIEEYNRARPFASFLPGIAGLKGRPLWAFYLNRGQCMASFGTGSKDGAIMEFYPANTAYRRTGLEGFRTFFRINGTVHEPFRLREGFGARGVRQALYISPHEFRIEEACDTSRVRCEVVYYTVPEEDFPALARMMRLENASSKTAEAEILDGMPKICPYGLNEFFMKHMSRTIEAWMEVAGLEEKRPFYRLRVDASDVAHTGYIEGGNFYLSVADAPGMGGKRPDIIVDPRLVFGDFCDFTHPAAFAGGGFSVPKDQARMNITPSAFSYLKAPIPAGGAITLYSIMGHARSAAQLKKIDSRLNAGFFFGKRIANKKIVDDAASSTAVFSRSEELDLYVRQTNLDNILRGGMPVTLGKGKTVYVFNRKHGDLERDYNDFVLKAEPYSQGNGSFRDTNQNRRNSLWMNPSLGAKDVHDFYDLIQLDGYNPLVIRAGSSSGRVDAEHAEGFWIDHWTYNLDLVESFLGLFPEKKEELIFRDREFLFFDNPYRVRPENRAKAGKRVFLDEEKKTLIDSRTADRQWARTASGRGRIYKCSLAAKMLVIIVNKMATLDERGVGIEMEADKPGWCDSLNGLPAIGGSSLSETIELLRLVRFLASALDEASGASAVPVPIEAASFLRGLDKALEKGFSPRRFHDAANALKAGYRSKTRFGVGGKEAALKKGWLALFLRRCAKKLEEAIRKGTDRGGVPYSYFRDGKSLPLFLEAPVHAMKIEKDAVRAKRLYENIRRSALYDKELSMYRLNAPLDREPLEIGRSRVFTPGWLENESVWLHMEYKYMLEVLRSGLYEEFYDDFRKALPPFQEPARYGRSILENSSFLASSRFFDPALRGTGFVARLTGATAEFLHILLVMNLGLRPFTVMDGKLIFTPSPVLHRTLFSEEAREIEFRFRKGQKEVNLSASSYAFSVFRDTLIIYSNPKMKSTFGKNGVKPVRYDVRYADGRNHAVKAPYLDEPHSRRLREGAVESLSILLG